MTSAYSAQRGFAAGCAALYNCFAIVIAHGVFAVVWAHAVSSGSAQALILLTVLGAGVILGAIFGSIAWRAVYEPVPEPTIDQRFAALK